MQNHSKYSFCLHICPLPCEIRVGMECGNTLKKTVVLLLATVLHETI